MISIKLLYSFIEIALWHGILLQSCWIFRRPFPKKHLWKAASVYLEMCLLRHVEFTDRYFNLAIITWKLLPVLEAVVRRCSGVLRNFVKLTGKHLCHLFIKKETLAHGFSCEFFEKCVDHGWTYQICSGNSSNRFPLIQRDGCSPATLSEIL